MFMKSKLPADAYSKINAAVPDADGMIAAAKAAPETSGGILGAVAGAVGKIFGGGACELVSKLTQLGFSADQLRAFVPKVLEFLKSKLPPDVLKQVSALIPAQEGSADNPLVNTGYSPELRPY
jgi:hypothetical protein